jgi:predicted GNAT family acetyltransferase
MPAAGSRAEPEVRDAVDASRYEIAVEGRLAGFVTYRRAPGRLELVHTEIDDAFEGQGLGKVLAREVLDEARREGLGVVPSCPFVRGFIERNPEYRDLVVT